MCPHVRFTLVAVTDNFQLTTDVTGNAPLNAAPCTPAGCGRRWGTSPPFSMHQRQAMGYNMVPDRDRPCADLGRLFTVAESVGMPVFLR
jgi:hypothetical protein